ncbi:hypothetical protein M378DRAFT_273778 [Amanita muscaria Koide BX008]|uniref:Uncharacterized protein n=1 Tax=Amanita muscaria (strain Koide BX008) TaxID=946122 RepID=A0A0C2TKW1_AMAMK|nr:hypothetical protein M378DRAFT_273778 [Amanita muscaria Koide BX008]
MEHGPTLEKFIRSEMFDLLLTADLAKWSYAAYFNLPLIPISSSSHACKTHPLSPSSSGICRCQPGQTLLTLADSPCPHFQRRPSLESWQLLVVLPRNLYKILCGNLAL